VTPDSPHNRLIAVIGATASGKTSAAAMIAARFSGEVINADSRLFYRGMEIGTAYPSTEILAMAPHHMIGFLEPEASFSLAQFLPSAVSSIRDIGSRNHLPVLAGGTGQYVWGLLEGWQVPIVAPDNELRAKLERELAETSVDALYGRLFELDADAAATTDEKNPRRVIRALERVISGHGSSSRIAIDPGYNALVIGLYVDRAELHRRIVARVDQMLADGWVDEVQRLIDSGIDFQAPALSAIGYREIADVIAGKMTLADARTHTIQATNRLVRHQNNWFKQSDPRISWIDVTDADLVRVVDRVREWLVD
jgi:tRNA dimethylallyltransferase